jgi:hypothetical protein
VTAKIRGIATSEAKPPQFCGFPESESNACSRETPGCYDDDGPGEAKSLVGKILTAGGCQAKPSAVR